MHESTNRRFFSQNNFWILLKLALLLGMGLYLWNMFQTKQQDLHSVFQYLPLALNHLVILLLVMVLTPINWALEAHKWQLLVKPLEEISFETALQATLSGLTLGVLTPLNVGDYAAKIGYLQPQSKGRSVGAITLGGGIQFYFSLVFGTLALSFFIAEVIPQPPVYVVGLCAGCWIAALLGAFLFKNTYLIGAFFEKIPLISRYSFFFEVMSQYPIQLLQKIVGVGFLRYVVFVIQLFLMFRVVEINLSAIHLLAITALVFFAKTVIPSFNFLSDLGVREFTALYFFSFFAVNPALVVAATLGLWLLNILLPVLVGVFFLFKFVPKS